MASNTIPSRIVHATPPCFHYSPRGTAVRPGGDQRWIPHRVPAGGGWRAGRLDESDAAHVGHVGDPVADGDALRLHETLDAATIASTPMGIVPASGVATYSTVATTIPGMIGRTLFFQGVTTRPRTLTHDFVQLTILP